MVECLPSMYKVLNSITTFKKGLAGRVKRKERGTGLRRAPAGPKDLKRRDVNEDPERSFSWLVVFVFPDRVSLFQDI